MLVRLSGSAAAALLCWVAIAPLSSAVAYPIAGVRPDQRPEGAPRVAEVRHDAAWYQRVVRGITEPYPGSLGFLEHQGNWYTPFNRPGMPGRYDLRDWFAGDRN